ncbi:hypothetical protein [Nostoc sp.]
MGAGVEKTDIFLQTFWTLQVFATQPLAQAIGDRHNITCIFLTVYA